MNNSEDKPKPDLGNRRPLASRQTGWAHAITRWLASTDVTPNQISMGCMVAAAVAAVCFWCSYATEGVTRVIVLLLAVLFCQLRLLCNLFDGMVAVEAGKHSADGAAWNEFPDRIADILILVGCGFAVGNPALGWAGATFAVLTAYVRELGVANQYPADFSGPMAKQHRMFVVSLGGLLAIVDPFFGNNVSVLEIALWLVVVGSSLTGLRRIYRLITVMNGT